MKSDDMMLNIRKPTPTNTTTSVPKENKRSKYSVKERIMRQKTGRSPRKGFDYNLLPTEDKHQDAEKNDKSQDNREGNFKRSRNF